MDPDVLLKAVSENPITSAIGATAIGSVGAFFRPIARALQAALVRRIDQAWAEDDDATPHAERVRRTVERVQGSTIVPLSPGYVERAVRQHKSTPPPDRGS